MHTGVSPPQGSGIGKRDPFSFFPANLFVA